MLIEMNFKKINLNFKKPWKHQGCNLMNNLKTRYNFNIISAYPKSTLSHRFQWWINTHKSTLNIWTYNQICQTKKLSSSSKKYSPKARSSFHTFPSKTSKYFSCSFTTRVQFNAFSRWKMFTSECRDLCIEFIHMDIHKSRWRVERNNKIKKKFQWWRW